MSVAAVIDMPEMLIRARGITVGFGDTTVLEGLDIDVRRGEVLGIVGGSGTGKSVLLRALIGLLPRRAGSVEMFGEDVDELSDGARREIGRRWGVLFQHGALFSSLTVRENVQVPMRENLDLDQKLMDELAELTLAMVGKFPAQLSGGMIKRAALARALALDPDIVFLDEPTSGLDPIGAADFDDLISKLTRTLDLAVFMVTHDLDSLHSICDRIAVLSRRKVLVAGALEQILAHDDAWVQEYFHGPRARAVLGSGGRA